MTRSHGSIGDVWLGVGMMDLIGWTLAIPSAIGLGIGLVLDNAFATEHGWAIVLFSVGLVLGFRKAWTYVSAESEALAREENRGE